MLYGMLPPDVLWSGESPQAKNCMCLQLEAIWSLCPRVVNAMVYGRVMCTSVKFLMHFWFNTLTEIECIQFSVELNRFCTELLILQNDVILLSDQPLYFPCVSLMVFAGPRWLVSGHLAIVSYHNCNSLTVSILFSVLAG